MSSPTIRELLLTIHRAKSELRQRGVIRSERFVGELGEWLAETAYGAKRANGTTQKGWDLEIAGESGVLRYQIKAHAKGEGNPARWTDIKPDRFDHFDRLVIIVMSSDYLITEWIDAPSGVARAALKPNGEGWMIPWNSLSAHKCDWLKLPGGHLLTDFAGPEYRLAS